MTDREVIMTLNEEAVGTDGVFFNAILDLINRTKEKEKHYRGKVQDQRKIINALQEKNNRQKAEVERLNKLVKQQYADGWNDAMREANVNMTELNRLRDLEVFYKKKTKLLRERIEALEKLTKDPKQSVVDRIIDMLIEEGQIDDCY